MIKINIKRDKEDNIQRFIVKGHAGFSEYGSDIVCAGVSAIAYTAVGAMKNMVGKCNYVEKNGYMECTVPEGISDEKKKIANIILEAAVIGFKQIEFSYREYVSVSDKEV